VTKVLTCYTFKGNTNFPPMKIIDTIGLGDTGGIRQDLINFDAIKNYLQTGPVKTVNSITFVAKSTDFRLTTEFVYSC